MTTSPADAAPARSVPLTPGSRVGVEDANQWEVVEHLAEGGFSSVYVVRPASAETADRFGTNERALKCIRGTPDELTQINSEIDKIAAVEGHENVLGLVASVRFRADKGTSETFVGLVLELAAEDLYGFARRGRPDEQGWAGVFEQVAAGLEHIHGRGMIHGDIKPSNVLRVGPTIKIADFGVSAPADHAGASPAVLARTLPYLPPESCPPGSAAADASRPAASRGAPSSTAMAATWPVPAWRPSQAGDVWALAVTMHRMLSGRHITAGITAEQQYELVCRGRYSIDDRLAMGWRRLFADCLAHDPSKRTITTAAELRRRLADLAVPDDYVGVPWLPGAPRIVAVLHGSGEQDRLVLYLTRPGGRVQGTFAAADAILDAARHLHDTAIPALAQQVRDAQREASRAAEERDRLHAELGRLAAAGPATEIMDPAETTAQIQRLSSEVTTVIHQRDELTQERDRLAREHHALIRRVEQLEQELNVQRRRADAAVEAEYYLPAAQQGRGRRILGGLLIVMFALAIASSIGLLVAATLTERTPQELVERIIDRLDAQVNGTP